MADPPDDVVVDLLAAAAVVVVAVEPLEPPADEGTVVVADPVDVGSLYAGALDEPVAPTVW